ncbi:uncharacterized protein LOC133181368 [Saccostrea echinata]|uniref:uncharacterized protein LOC133181368 n=1 Tax=Saccostrea echinata TaxID=191078 RepID=UPI002A810E3F|nr:uncharacterized protein LOC133181368 [Saccostrea echinata]
MTAMTHIGGMLELLKIDAAEEKSIEPLQLPPDSDKGCTAADVEKEDGCDAKFGLIMKCVRDGVVSVINNLKSDADALEKIKFAKAVINQIGAGAEGIFMLAEACYGDKDKNPYQHWVDTWTASEEDVKNAPAEEIERYTQLLLKDLGEVVKTFDVLLSGEGTKEDGIRAIHHIGGMMHLLQLDAASEKSIDPMDLPADSDNGCTAADVEKEDGCDAKFGLVLRCIRGGVVAVMDGLKSDKDAVTKIGFAKAIINKIGEGGEGVFKLAEACYGNNNKYDHWVDTWKATEEDVAKASDEEVKRYTGLLLRDLQDVVDNLNVVLSGEGSKEAGIRAMQHIAGMMELLRIDAEEGKQSIRPMDLPEGSDKGCTAADVEKQDSCDAKFGVILTCVKGGVVAVMKNLKSDSDVVKKISFAKAVINSIGARAKDIFYLAHQCYGDTKEADKYQHWVDTWMSTEEEIKNAPAEKVKRYTSLLLKDLRMVVGNIDSLLSGKGGEAEGLEAMKHIGGMMELLRLHSEEGEESIQPMELPKDSDKGCTAADVEGKEGCDAKFGLILGCVKKGLVAVINVLESDEGAVAKVKFAKAVIHSIGAEAEGIFQLAEYCYGGKKEKLEKGGKPAENKKMLDEKKTKREKLERLLLEYLNRK